MGSVEWYVEALFDGCPATRSASGNFTAGAVPCDSNARPSLTAPDDGVTITSPVTFGYRVWIAVGEQFPIIVASTTETAAAAVPSGTIQWFVEALFDGCPPTFSDRRAITIAPASNCPTVPPVLQQPVAGTTVSNPVTFWWTEVPEAFGYTVWAEVDGDTPSIYGTTAKGQTTFSRTMPPGLVHWFVEALVGSCAPLRSESNTFTVPRSQDCDGAPPVLVSPAAGAADQPGLAEFDWNALPKAVEYRVWAKADTGNAEVVASTLVSTKALAPFYGTNVEWWVQALFNGCPSTESEHRTFTLAGATPCSGAKATLLAPPQESVTSQTVVTFAWSSVADAVGYRVRASVNAGTYSTVAIVHAPAVSVTVGETYRLTWTPVAGSTIYEVQQSSGETGSHIGREISTPSAPPRCPPGSTRRPILHASRSRRPPR